MIRKVKVSDLPEFDITEHLDSEQAIAEFITIVLEENNPAALGQGFPPPFPPPALPPALLPPLVPAAVVTPLALAEAWPRPVVMPLD
jgi:hypothetical protein